MALIGINATGGSRAPRPNAFQNLASLAQAANAVTTGLSNAYDVLGIKPEELKVKQAAQQLEAYKQGFTPAQSSSDGGVAATVAPSGGLAGSISSAPKTYDFGGTKYVKSGLSPTDVATIDKNPGFMYGTGSNQQTIMNPLTNEAIPIVPRPLAPKESVELQTAQTKDFNDNENVKIYNDIHRNLSTINDLLFDKNGNSTTDPAKQENAYMLWKKSLVPALARLPQSDESESLKADVTTKAQQFGDFLSQYGIVKGGKRVLDPELQRSIIKDLSSVEQSTRPYYQLKFDEAKHLNETNGIPFAIRQLPPVHIGIGSEDIKSATKAIRSGAKQAPKPTPKSQLDNMLMVE